MYESIASRKTCSNTDNSEALLRNAVKARSGTPEAMVLFCVSLKLVQSNSYPVVKIFHFTALPFLENFIPDTQCHEMAISEQNEKCQKCFTGKKRKMIEMLGGGGGGEEGA